MPDIFESDPIIITVTRIDTFAEIAAIYGYYSAQPDGGHAGLYDEISDDEGSIADIPFDLIARILETFRLTDDRTAAAERDEASPFDRNDPDLMDVRVYESDGSFDQWWFDSSNLSWWTDTNGEGTPDLNVQYIGGSWWADLDFNGTFEREVSPGG